MRNYMLFEAQAREMLPNAGWLRNFWRNWTARRRVRGLAELDDRILRDIGVTREEIEWATQLPLNVNPAAELERHARTRARSCFSDL